MAETNFKLLSGTNQTYHNIKFTAGGTLVAGNMHKLGDVVGVVVEDAESGDVCVLVTKANNIMLQTAAAPTGGFAVGERVYFDSATKKAITADDAATGDLLVGFVAVAPEVGDTEVEVDFDGALALT